MDSPNSKDRYFEELQNGPLRIAEFIDHGISDDLLDFRPDIEDAWTIRGHIVHLLDSDVHYYILIRMALTDPGAKVNDSSTFVNRT